MIFGLGPVPRMGIRGAAWATGLGQLLTLAAYLFFAWIRPLPVKISLKNLKFDRALLKKIYAVGIPATLNMALSSLLISSLNAIRAAYGQMYVMILGVYYKLQTFLYLPANGIIQGMRPLIGYNYGAGEQKRVHKLYSYTLYLSAGIMLAGTLLCMIIPGTLLGLFTTTPQTIAAGSTALRIISLGFIVSSVSITSCGALEGLGKGVPSLMISLCRYTILILPLAFLLSRIVGPTGVWHAFWICEAITAVISYTIYRKASA